MPIDKYKFAEILSLPNILILIMAFLLFYSLFQKNRKLVNSKIYLYLFLLFFLSIVSSVLSDNINTSARNGVTLLSGIMIVILVINICNNYFIYNRVIITIFQSSIVVSIYGILQFIFYLITGDLLFGSGTVNSTGFIKMPYIVQANSFFDSGIILGHYLLLPLILGIVIWPHITKWKHRFLIKTSVILSFITLVLTFSRGAWVPLIIFILYLIYNKIKKYHKSVKYILLLLFTFGLVKTAIPIFDYIVRLRPMSTYNRAGIIYSSLNSIYENPFIGRGLGSTVGQKFPNDQYALFSREAQKMGKKLDIDIGKTFGRETHNTFLQVAVDLGLIGLFLYFILLFMIWKKRMLYEKLADNYLLSLYGNGIITAFVFLTICSIFSSVFFVKQTWVIIGLVLAGANVTRNNHTLEIQNGHPNLRYL